MGKASKDEFNINILIFTLDFVIAVDQMVRCNLTGNKVNILNLYKWKMKQSI